MKWAPKILGPLNKAQQIASPFASASEVYKDTGNGWSALGAGVADASVTILATAATTAVARVILTSGAPVLVIGAGVIVTAVVINAGADLLKNNLIEGVQ